MARTGRKRKQTPRQPNGQPVRYRVEMTPEYRDRCARVVGLDNVKVWDKSILHALMLTKQITAEEREAGRKFGALVSRYRALLTVPRDTVGHPSGREGVDDPEEFEKVRKAYNAAFVAIGGNAERRLVRAVLLDEVIHDVVCLRRGLCNLALHFGLT